MWRRRLLRLLVRITSGDGRRRMMTGREVHEARGCPRLQRSVRKGMVAMVWRMEV
jgi:hypothetical protein